MAAKYMPMASIKIGVDLDPIKPIKGCITHIADITTPRCVNLVILEFLKILDKKGIEAF